MSKKNLDPPFPPKSWAGLPRALAKNRNNVDGGRASSRGSAGAAATAAAAAAAAATEADTEAAAATGTAPADAAGDRTKYSLDFENIEIRYGQKLALARDCFRDQSFAIVVGTQQPIPGLNAVLLSIVRTAHFVGAKVYFIKSGLRGLMSGRRYFEEVTWSRVTNVAGLSNCIIDVESCPTAFDSVEARRKAAKNLIDHLALNLVVVGGEATLEQAIRLKNEWSDHVYELIEDGTIRTDKAKEMAKKFQLVGVVASAENDYVGGSELNELLGMDTQLRQISNIADDIDNTSTRRQRVTVVTVHGCRSGALAARAALLLEADWLFTPESPPIEGWEETLVAKIKAAKSQSGTLNNVVVIAEGSRRNTGEIIGASTVCEAIKKAEAEMEIKVDELGHRWVGASPSCFDRVMGFRFGVEAVLSCMDQFNGIPPHKESVDSSHGASTSLAGESESLNSIDPAVPVILTIQGNSLSRVSFESFQKSVDKWRQRMKNKLAKGASNDKYRSVAFQAGMRHYNDVTATESREFDFESKASAQGDSLAGLGDAPAGPGDVPAIIESQDQGDDNTNTNRFVIPRRNSSSSSDGSARRQSLRSLASRRSEKSGRSGRSGRSSRKGGVCLPDERVSIGIVFVGAPCAGMNSVLFAFSRFVRRLGCRPVGFTGGTKGMCDLANVRDLTSWFSVQGHLGRGGCALGVGDDVDFLPAGESVKLIAANLARQHIQGLVIVGGFKAFQTALKFHRERETNREYRIPIKVIPATTFGNMAGTDISLGCDTNLNQILDDINDLRHSSEGSQPVLHLVSPAVPHKAEDGHNCGFLTTVAALAANAEASYILEETFDETDIKADALEYKLKMYDGLRHGVFFVNNTWDENSVDEKVSSDRASSAPESMRSVPRSTVESALQSAPRSTLGSARSNGRESGASRGGASRGGTGAGADALRLSDVGETSLLSLAKGGLKGIIDLFEEYGVNPEECHRSEYRVRYSTLASRCGEGRPSPADRLLAVRLTISAIEKIMRDFLEEEFRAEAKKKVPNGGRDGKDDKTEEDAIEGLMTVKPAFLFPLEANEAVEVVGIVGARMVFTPVQHLIRGYDFQSRIPRNLWWLALRPIARILAAHFKTYDYLTIDIYRKRRDSQYKSDPDWVPELEEKIRQLERGEDDDDDDDYAPSVASGYSAGSGGTGRSRRRRIVVVRNTMTQLRENRVFQGWLDIPLNEDGEREARYLGALFKDNEMSFDVVFTSFLTRHTSTAYYIQTKMGLEKIPNHKSWRLNSRMLGQLEGLSRLEAVEKFGGGKVTDWCNSPFAVPPAISQDSAMWPGHDPRYADVPPSEIPVAESQADTMERFVPFWNRIIKPTLEMNNDVLIVAGKNVQRALLKVVYGITDSELDEWELEFEALTPLVVDLDRKWKPLTYYFLEGEGLENYDDSDPNLDLTSGGQNVEGEGKEAKNAGEEGEEEGEEEDGEEEDEE